MDNINKTLLMSLKQDLQTLNESIENINIESDLQSWLFPTKNYKFVKEFIKENNIFGINNVKLVLELIIDRLYIGIRLILTKIEKNIKDDNSETSHFLLQPSQMTVACCFENLRKVVNIILDRMDDKEAITKSEVTPSQQTVIKIKTKKHCKTQTDVVSMPSCDSCASAIMSMKFLLNVFDVAKDDIYQVKKVQSSLHDLTQFGCMLHATASIEQSLKQLIEKLIKSEDKHKQLTEKIEKLTTQLLNKNGTVILLEQENTTLNDALKKTGVQLAILKNKISDLEINKVKDEEKIANLNTLTEGLNSTLSMYRDVNGRLKEEKTALEKIFQQTRIVIKQCAQRVPIFEKKLLTMEKEQCCILDEFDVLNNCLENLSTKLKKISKSHTGMENKLKMLKCDVAENTECVTNDFKTFQEKVQTQLLHANLNVLSRPQTASKIQIKGNPAEDFARQIEENNEKIQALQNENKKLETVLSKFKSIKK